MFDVRQRVMRGVWLLAFGAVLTSSFALADPHDGGRWVGAWGASPSDPAPQLSGQTVREHVRLSAGGERFRLRLSNRFGTRSLVVGATHLALHGGNEAMVAGSDTKVTFHGAASVTIPPGALVVSDPVQFRAAALQEVAISLYLPGDTGPLTIHSLGVQTTCISTPGDFTASALLPVSTTCYQAMAAAVRLSLFRD